LLVAAGESMYDLDPNAVVQETKAFNELKPKTTLCRSILSKILFVLSHGERLSEKDATEIFFNSTKLFQSKDVCRSPHSFPSIAAIWRCLFALLLLLVFFSSCATLQSTTEKENVRLTLFTMFLFGFLLLVRALDCHSSSFVHRFERVE
jgi:hypothetical protein